jgi:anti-sigma B factor antagonist
MVRGLEITVIHPGDELQLVGRLDAHSAAMARSTLHGAVDAGSGSLLLRAADLQIWDGAGLGVLVGISRRARRRGRVVVLTDVAPRELRLLRATRLTRMLEVQPVALAG